MFTLVRHAESTANAGMPSDNPGSILLSELGYQQAQAFADSYTGIPSYIVHSKYDRTKLTAKPLAAKLNMKPVLDKNCHEFTYLDTTKYVNSTVSDRRSIVVSYWENMDCFFRDGNAESFADFASRVSTTLLKYAVGSRDGVRHFEGSNALIFTHEMFIQLATLIWTENPKGNLMELFHTKRKNILVPNASAHEFAIENDMRVVKTTFLK